MMVIFTNKYANYMIMFSKIKKISRQQCFYLEINEIQN